MTKEIDIAAAEKQIAKDKIIPRGKYGKSAEKALTFDELDYLRYNLESRRDKIVLIGLAFAGKRISELIQCRKDWLRWDTLQAGDKKLRVLAIDIPKECKDIFNLYGHWRPKTKLARTTYILDENLAELFHSYYIDHPKGISEEFNSVVLKSISRNISTYTIGSKFLKLLIKFHKEANPELSDEKINEIRPKLSSHPLRSTFENLLFYKYRVSIDICANILGHSPEVAKKHYISKSTGNIKNKLAQEVLNGF